MINIRIISVYSAATSGASAPTSNANSARKEERVIKCSQSFTLNKM